MPDFGSRGASNSKVAGGDFDGRALSSVAHGGDEGDRASDRFAGHGRRRHGNQQQH